jgi:Tfp pilus assembly protein PilN
VSTLFNINFRREAYLKEMARARRRVVLLGVWVGYFGVVAVAMGLYGLNCASMSRRVALLERQTERAQANQTVREQWQIAPAEMTRIEGYLSNPRRWHDRLVRLVGLLPANARLTSIASNPNNQTGARADDRLVITGQMQLERNADRMAGVMALVSTLREDSLFAAHYPNVRLATTRIVDVGNAEFVIECQ